MPFLPPKMGGLFQKTPASWHVPLLSRQPLTCGLERQGSRWFSWPLGSAGAVGSDSQAPPGPGQPRFRESPLLLLLASQVGCESGDIGPPCSSHRRFWSGAQCWFSLQRAVGSVRNAETGQQGSPERRRLRRSGRKPCRPQLVGDDGGENGSRGDDLK